MDTNVKFMSSTYIQRNFGRVMEEENDPIVVLSDSEPKKVILSFDEYMRIKKEQEEIKDKEFFAMLDKIHARNSHISEEELDKDIEEALEHVRGRSHSH